VGVRAIADHHTGAVRSLTDRARLATRPIAGNEKGNPASPEPG